MAIMEDGGSIVSIARNAIAAQYLSAFDAGEAIGVRAGKDRRAVNAVCCGLQTFWEMTRKGMAAVRTAEFDGLDFATVNQALAAIWFLETLHSSDYLAFRESIATLDGPPDPWPQLDGRCALLRASPTPEAKLRRGPKPSEFLIEHAELIREFRAKNPELTVRQVYAAFALAFPHVPVKQDAINRALYPRKRASSSKTSD